MRPPRIAPLFTTALLTVALVGCSTDSGAPTEEGPSASATTSATADPSSAVEIPSGVAPTNTFAVGVRQLDLNRDAKRPLPVTVWYPSVGSSGKSPQPNAKVADGRFPIVVFSHGLTGLPDDYAPLLGGWAAAGFVVAAPTYPHTSRGASHLTALDVLNQPADASYVLTELLALDGADSDPLRGHLATDRIAAAGHSAGGITTVGLFTTARDKRLSAGIVLAGSALGVGTNFSGPAAPQLFVHGKLDDVVSYASGKALYDAVPWPKAMLSLPDGDHGQSLLRDNNPAFAVVAETTVDFLRWSLYGDPAAKSRLTGPGESDVAVFDNRL